MRFRAAAHPAVLRAVLVLGLASSVNTLGPGAHNPSRAQEEDDGLVLYGWDADAREEQDEWGMPAFRERHIKVQRLSPAFGRHAGGLLVNVTGKGVARFAKPQQAISLQPLTHMFCNAGFVVATDPKCQFGGEDSMMVNATVKSANWIQCLSPPQSEADGGIPWARTYDVYSRAVEVSLNGVDWTTSNRAFTYYGEPLRLPWAASATLTGRPSLVRQRTISCTSRCLSHREVRLLETPRCTMPSETAGQPHA